MAAAPAVQATDRWALGHPLKSRSPNMWPVQTLTLLLCLTDEEQLFAMRLPEPAPVVIEQEAPAVEDEPACAPFEPVEEEA